ncbi:MAG: TetR/AcrR family transcriptional regulator [Myxococcales bacterium]|nr:TetR/AcrR family transcriptional regulator [Myxococcales bacterium]
MQPAVTESLTRELFVEWAERGYAAISLERVAQRAGVGKAALYRRWPSKLAMVVDRLEAVGIAPEPLPDTGALASDVRAMLAQLRRLLRHPLVGRILPDLHAEMPRNPELAAAVRGRLQVERRRRGGELFTRAVTRGELPPDTDLELLSDAVAALLYWRLIVTRGRADDAYLDTLTAFILTARSTTCPSASPSSAPCSPSRPRCRPARPRT